MTSTPAGTPSTASERVGIVTAVLTVLFFILVIAVIGLFKLFDPIEPLAVLAAAVVLLWMLSVVGIALTQSCLKSKFRVPTNREVVKDLLLSLWGVVFTVPLLIVTATGELIPFDETWVPACLALVGVVVPAIRPRCRKAQTTPLS